MIKIASHAWMMRVVVLGEMITASGVICLGAVLFVILRKQNETIALIALEFYILEVALGAARLIAAFSLLRVSQEFVTGGQPAYLLTLGSLAAESMESAYKLLMFPFCLGAILFYYLLYKARTVPRVLSLWGLIAVLPVFLGTLLAIFGYQPSWFLYLPYIPFEFTIGVWILVKGINTSAVMESVPSPGA